ncbi:Rec8 like protein-domain-containing protein [Scheffersomyces xylosifermentans]|uniref:Rec8 like protein-domain-containing protein n=1 Tax=Scheffersomyces xylosifermentans TaxID=1304137 RepID=UPI00315D079C
MYSDTLISKQGPLGYVWLAANYDKKLTKQQLLNTSIVKSTDFISNHSISYSASQSTAEDNSITLRLSGQLLLGIVRIYSRKTKYLLDDVSDILLKLKTSFKYASGVKLGSDNISNQINLNPRDTIISNVKSITLQDQITRFDLLYQDDLNLDDDVPSNGGGVGIFSQRHNSQEDSFTFDQSIEYPRFNETLDPATPGDVDLELDFDLDMGGDDEGCDRSIEVGRNASQIQNQDSDMSVLDFNKDNGNNTEPFDFDLGNPLETIDEPGLVGDTEMAETPHEAVTPPEIVERRPRVKRTGITEDGEIITNKRKLKIDSLEDLDGISIQTLKDNQQSLLDARFEDGYITVNLTESEKLQLIQELANPMTNKRRKIWNVDAQLQERCLELSKQQQELEEQHNLQFENENDFNDFSNDIDFDLSLPDFENDTNNEIQPEQLPSQSDDLEEERSSDSIAKSTIQVAENLRDIFSNDETTDLDKLMEADLHINEKDNTKDPLGLVNRHDETKKVNQRREATRCFFELLVLATNDCVDLQQESQETELGGRIDIRSRDRLFHNFL